MHPSASKRAIQRRITLLRHAKAMPDERGDDHARTLTPQGREAAVALGAWLRENDFLPQLVLCSTATRTRETLAALNEILPTELYKGLYLSSAGEMLALLQGGDDAIRHVMVVGHNPGLHGLAASLAREFVRDEDGDAMAHHFPTCGLISMTVEIDHWKELTPQSSIVDALRFSGND